MRSWPLSRHVLTAVLIIVLIYVLFTLLPGIFPHPEDFSPWVYLIAFIALVGACMLLPKGVQRWPYWSIAFLCLLALLDESGYGVEIFGWQPIYISEYHAYVRDLHSLADLGIELLFKWLNEMQWSGTQFAIFLMFDLGLLLMAGLITWIGRWRMAKATQTQQRQRIKNVAFTAMAIAGLTAAAILLALPADPKNAVLLGYSAIRLGSVVLILAGSLAPLWLERKSKTNVVDRLLSGTTRFSPAALWLISLAGLAYQTYVPFVFLPDQQAQFTRVTPLVLWLLTMVTIIATARVLWRGGLRRPLLKYWSNIVSLGRKEPSYFYVGVALVLIFIAQLIDQDLIPLNQWIVTPGFHVRLWGLWTEETFEMTGAFMFMVSAWLFPRKHVRASGNGNKPTRKRQRNSEDKS